MKVTIDDLVRALETANSEVHGSREAMIGTYEPETCMIDGTIDLCRVVDLINKRVGE